MYITKLGHKDLRSTDPFHEYQPTTPDRIHFVMVKHLGYGYPLVWDFEEKDLATSAWRKVVVGAFGSYTHRMEFDRSIPREHGIDPIPWPKALV